jgi:hypothetical protein
MSMRSNDCRQRATASWTEADCVTSAVNGSQMPPSARMMPAVSSAAAPLRSIAKTLAPSRA